MKKTNPLLPKTQLPTTNKIKEAIAARRAEGHKVDGTTMFMAPTGVPFILIRRFMVQNVVYNKVVYLVEVMHLEEGWTTIVDSELFLNRWTCC